MPGKATHSTTKLWLATCMGLILGLVLPYVFCLRVIQNLARNSITLGFIITLVWMPGFRIAELISPSSHCCPGPDGLAFIFSGIIYGLFFMLVFRFMVRKPSGPWVVQGRETETQGCQP